MPVQIFCFFKIRLLIFLILICKSLLHMLKGFYHKYFFFLPSLEENKLVTKLCEGASVVAQWERIRLPKQETRVWSLVWEDPTCHEATKRVHPSYWACGPEPRNHNYWALAPQRLKPAHPGAHAQPREKPPTWEAHTLQLESSSCLLQLKSGQQQRPSSTPK